MQYTQQQFENDSRTANFIFNKYFSKYKFYKEDMIQECLIQLLKTKKLFKTGGATYRTYACRICYNCMFNFVRHNCNDKYIFQSLNDKLTDDLTVEDTLGQEMTYLNDIGLVDVIKEVYRNSRKNLKSKSRTYCKYIKLKVQGFNNKEIQEELNCTRQFVSKLAIQFRNEILEVARKHELKEILVYGN